jgi:hypothetical protein
LELALAAKLAPKDGAFAPKVDANGNWVGCAFNLVPVTPVKDNDKGKATALPAPSLESQLAALSDDEFQQLVAARAAAVV